MHQYALVAWQLRHNARCLFFEEANHRYNKMWRVRQLSPLGNGEMQKHTGQQALLSCSLAWQGLSAWYGPYEPWRLAGCSKFSRLFAVFRRPRGGLAPEGENTNSLMGNLKPHRWELWTVQFFWRGREVHFQRHRNRSPKRPLREQRTALQLSSSCLHRVCQSLILLPFWKLIVSLAGSICIVSPLCLSAMQSCASPGSTWKHSDIVRLA